MPHELLETARSPQSAVRSDIGMTRWRGGRQTRVMNVRTYIHYTYVRTWGRSYKQYL